MDGSRPSTKARVSVDELDGPRVRRGNEVRQQHLDLVLERDPVEEERS
jgi:hypothetical protein